MVRGYTQNEVLKQMRKRQGARSLVEFAKDLGISHPFLSDIYKGKRNPGTAVLAELGLKQVLVYVKCDSETPELKATTRFLQTSAF